MLENPYTRLHDQIADLLSDNLPSSWLDRNLSRVARIIDRVRPRYRPGSIVTLPPIGDRPRAAGRAWHEGAVWALDQIRRFPLTFSATNPFDAYEGPDLRKLVELEAMAGDSPQSLDATLRVVMPKVQPSVVREAQRIRDLAKRKQAGPIVRAKADYWEGVSYYAKAALRAAENEDGVSQAEDLREAVIAYLRAQRGP